MRAGRDLHFLAEGMLHWEEKLSAPMALTTAQVHDIKHGEDQAQPALQRYTT